MKNISLMQLDKCILSSLNIEARQGLLDADIEKEDIKKDDNEKIKLSFSFELHQHKKQQRYWVILSTSATWPKNCVSQYTRIDVKLNGFFSFPDDTSEKDLATYFPFSCLAHLYGMTRVLLMQITGGMGENKIVLPLMDMFEIVKSLSDKKTSKKHVSTAQNPS